MEALYPLQSTKGIHTPSTLSRVAPLTYHESMTKAFRGSLLFALAVLLLWACARADDTPTPMPSPTGASTSTPLRVATPTPTESTPQEEPPAVNLIAYIGTDGALYTIAPGGGEPSGLMGEKQGEPALLMAEQGPGEGSVVFHTWPTWSPDGRKLAVSRLTVQGTDSLRAEVFSITRNSQTTRLYQDPPGVTPLIADNTPHYLYWSPDSRHLTFLAKGAQNLDLFVSSIDDPEQLLRVINGAPLYWAWAPDSLSILLHVGDSVLLLDLTTPAGPIRLDPSSIGFRTPAWSPVSGQMAYIDRAPQGRDALYVADHDGKNQQPVADVGDSTAFLWSPTGNSIAFLDTDVPTSPFYNALRVVDLESGAVRTLTSEQVVSFFWSPDGEKIAYVAFDPLALGMSWKVLDPKQGQPRKLVDFLPSQELFLLLSYFDQYAYSNSLWSPESQYLVFAGRLVPEVGMSDGDQVFVMDVNYPSALQAIAEGSIAFWSWN